MKNFSVVTLLCLVLVTAALSLPTLPVGGESLDNNKQTPTDNTFDGGRNALQEYDLEASEEDLDEPMDADDDDLETAEVLVFRPLFSYRRVQAARRRNQQRNLARRRALGYPYYPYRQY
ncbi:uncharacterized protein [Periplaneta americana]|uniref:uncharacterized protein n=1 Tax=Periplaneta americana TaxID=6978 RepID=UPI0037E7F797